MVRHEMVRHEMVRHEMVRHEMVRPDMKWGDYHYQQMTEREKKIQKVEKTFLATNNPVVINNLLVVSITPQRVTCSESENSLIVFILVQASND